MLKEEHVKPVSMDWDVSGLVSGTGKQQKDGAAAGLFEMLFAQLNQREMAEPLAAVGPHPARSPLAAGPADPSAPPAAGQALASARPESPLRPIQRLKKSLEATGQPLTRFEVAAQDRDKLEEVLVMSGYSREDAQEMIARASKKDGTVNLGVLFGVMEQYTPDKGPVFLLKAEDKPLLMQVLKELGLPDGEVRRFLESLPRRGEYLVVSGLPKLVARAMELQAARGGATEVDQDLLRDLLTRLGLKAREVDTLLAKATDGQGRTHPQALLALLEHAAARQDQRVKGALQALAQKLKIAGQGQEPAPDAERLKAQVMQILQKAEMQAKPLQHQQAKPLQDKEAQKELIRLVKEQVETQAARATEPEPEAKGHTRGQNQGHAQARGNLAGAKAAPAAPAKGAAPKEPSFRASLAAAALEARPAGAGRAAAVRGSLPAQVVRQVSNQIAQMAKGNLSQLRLALKPPALGELTVKLTLREGVLKATLIAETSAAKHALEVGLQDLKQQLAQQGLKPERLEVVISPDAERREARGNEQGGDGRRRPGSRGGTAALETEEDEITPLAAGLAGANGRVNLFA